MGMHREKEQAMILVRCLELAPEDVEEVREAILASIERVGVSSPMMAAAKRKLMLRDP